MAKPLPTGAGSRRTNLTLHFARSTDHGRFDLRTFPSLSAVADQFLPDITSATSTEPGRPARAPTGPRRCPAELDCTPARLSKQAPEPPRHPPHPKGCWPHLGSPETRRVS